MTNKQISDYLKASLSESQTYDDFGDTRPAEYGVDGKLLAVQIRCLLRVLENEE